VLQKTTARRFPFHTKSLGNQRKSKNNPSPQLTDIQKQENRAHSKIRVAVENAIGGMKHFYCLTHRIRNHSTELIDQFFALSAGLWNFKIS
jgi:hypothetical protein